MYNYFEVICTLDGVIKRINVPAKDILEVNNIITNMFSGQKVEVLNCLLCY